MTRSFTIIWKSAPTLTYAQPDDPWLVRQLIFGIENLFGRRKVQRLYDKLKSQPFELKRFYEDAIAVTNIDVRYDPTQLEKIPATGPLVMVANHPFGVMDGTFSGASRPDQGLPRNLPVGYAPVVAQARVVPVTTSHTL